MVTGIPNPSGVSLGVLYLTSVFMARAWPPIVRADLSSGWVGLVGG